MELSALRCDHHDGVATLTLDRAKRHNAFDDDLIAALTGQLNALNADPKVHCVILAGAGPSFCAGADLGWMKRMAGYDEAENRRDALALGELMQTLDQLTKPTLARVHGPAFGGGVGLVAACDIALATPRAVFALSEVRLGLIPATISPYVVAAIGTRQARRYCLTAERFDAAEALRIGLVHEVVAEEQLDARIGELVEQLRGNAPGAMADAKRLVADVAQREIDTELTAETARRIAHARVGAEGREGIGAFLERRAPVWPRANGTHTAPTEPAS